MLTIFTSSLLLSHIHNKAKTSGFCFDEMLKFMSYCQRGTKVNAILSNVGEDKIVLIRTNSRNIICRNHSMVIPLLANQDLTPMLHRNEWFKILILLKI